MSVHIYIYLYISYISDMTDTKFDKVEFDKVEFDKVESDKVKRKYNSIYRKQLIDKINIIKDEDTLIDIYNILNEDIGNNYSINNNGVFININIVSDSCINILDCLINNLTNKVNYNIDIYNTKYENNTVEKLLDMGHKLSNKEKLILKKNHE